MLLYPCHIFAGLLHGSTRFKCCDTRGESRLSCTPISRFAADAVRVCLVSKPSSV